jgi:hypothetical protein
MCCWTGDVGADIAEARRTWTTIMDSTVGDVVTGREEVGEYLYVPDIYPLDWWALLWCYSANPFYVAAAKD